MSVVLVVALRDVAAVVDAALARRVVGLVAAAVVRVVIAARLVAVVVVVGRFVVVVVVVAAAACAVAGLGFGAQGASLGLLLTLCRLARFLRSGERCGDCRLQLCLRHRRAAARTRGCCRLASSGCWRTHGCTLRQTRKKTRIKKNESNVTKKQFSPCRALVGVSATPSQPMCVSCAVCVRAHNHSKAVP